MESSIYSVVAFYGLALTILGAATLVVFVRNIVHSVLFLAVTFVAMAGLFLLLDADFIAAVQVLVYAGAVCIMVVFGIMLIQRADMKATNLFNKQLLAGGGLVALVVALCAVLAGRTAWTELVTAQEVPANTVQFIGTLLLSKYVIPFEVAALLLLVALVGAIVIARDEEVKANARD
ncbi:NADH-quinone oxidoreductase subunit J family protein [Desulfoscipio geothermicus]|uniref:NADH-quinone oxidoreductase subunit J n=1 Tax=Desulfoscipio geothermicus DSM 3669 TaxID=1121426 RepID=A0A1I6D667_9FIRM|nr:NADH-quinone oxidoreductase subunit J [Desulfoscipio geothermicus]SFR00974.1 NADH dehydrogenase subunit J [Desulfoscipio geothermicus DSM 3669]